MAETIQLASRYDDFSFGAHRVMPGDARRGGLVAIQEIFGVTEHIRELADGFAEDGYEVIAPRLFDRLEPGFEGGYDSDGVAAGRRLSEATPWDQVAGDLQACVDALVPPVFAVGWCWGGTAAWLAACRCDGLAAASGFYGRRIPELLDETPRCPVILHFGKADPTIPPEVVEAVRAAHPDTPAYVYDAGHGFMSDRRADFAPDAAALGRLRTLQAFHRAGGARGEV